VGVIDMGNINEIEAKLMTHEAVCAERYAGINARLKRLEHILMASAGTIIVLLIGLVAKV
jgi:hypothetical protein